MNNENYQLLHPLSQQADEKQGIKFAWPHYVALCLYSAPFMAWHDSN